MKQLILILHLMSGNTLIVPEHEAAWLLRSADTFSPFFKGHQQIKINGNNIHLNMAAVEYIDESYIEVPDTEVK